MAGKPVKSYWSGGHLYFDEKVAASGYGIYFNCKLIFDDTSVTDILTFSAAATNLLKADASGDGGITVSADGMNQDPETASEDGYITIDVAGTSYEIPFYAAA